MCIIPADHHLCALQLKLITQTQLFIHQIFLEPVSLKIRNLHYSTTIHFVFFVLKLIRCVSCSVSS